MGMSTFNRIRKAAAKKEKARRALVLQSESVTNETTDLDNMNIKDLKNYAQEHDINIDGLTKKDDIRAKIFETIKGVTSNEYNTD